MAACWAFFIFEAATSSIAFVIWRVFLTDLMRRRMSRVEAMREIYDSGFMFRDGGALRAAAGRRSHDHRSRFGRLGGEGSLPLVARGLQFRLEVFVEGSLVANFGEEG